MTQSDLAFLRSACNVVVILNLCVGAKSNIGPLSPACARFDVYLIDAKIMPYSDFHLAKAVYSEVNYSFFFRRSGCRYCRGRQTLRRMLYVLGYSCRTTQLIFCQLL